MRGMGEHMSTLSIMRTHSVARLSADVVTSNGCTTFSSSMLLTVPCTPNAHHASCMQLITLQWKHYIEWTWGSANIYC